MEPIINPWLVYFVHIANAVNMMCTVVATIGVISSVVLSIVYILMTDLEIKSYPKVLPTLKYSIIIALIGGIGAMLIPDKNTVITMISLHYATPENIQAAQIDIVDFITKIVDVIERK